MTGEMIAGLLVKYGPIAFEWVKELVKVWKKEMTPAELDALIAAMPTDYESYITAAGGRPK
jgi:hypothetical protein